MDDFLFLVGLALIICAYGWIANGCPIPFSSYYYEDENENDEDEYYE